MDIVKIIERIGARWKGGGNSGCAPINACNESQVPYIDINVDTEMQYEIATP